MSTAKQRQKDIIERWGLGSMYRRTGLVDSRQACKDLAELFEQLRDSEAERQFLLAQMRMNGLVACKNIMCNCNGYHPEEKTSTA